MLSWVAPSKERFQHGKFTATKLNSGWTVYKRASGHKLSVVAEGLTRSAAIIIMEKGSI